MIPVHTADSQLDETFVLPVIPLHSDRIDLIPLNRARDVPLLWEGVKDTPEVYLWMRDGPFDNAQHMHHTFSGQIDSPGRMRYAIYITVPPDVTSPKAAKVLAGWIAINSVNIEEMTAGIGILVLKPFHRTHVATHACGLVLHRLLDPPDKGGYGFKRVGWWANERNISSQKAALRLGFTVAGASQGHIPPKEGVHTRGDNWMAYLSVGQWENKGRDHVDWLMKRTV